MKEEDLDFLFDLCCFSNSQTRSTVACLRPIWCLSADGSLDSWIQITAFSRWLNCLSLPCLQAMARAFCPERAKGGSGSWQGMNRNEQSARPFSFGTRRTVNTVQVHEVTTLFNIKVLLFPLTNCWTSHHLNMAWYLPIRLICKNTSYVSKWRLKNSKSLVCSQLLKS